MTASVTVKANRIAVLVHNDVVKDARVLKEVATLGAAGHLVDVIGASSNQDTYPTKIPGARSLNIVDISHSSLRAQVARLRFLKGYAKIISAALLLLIGSYSINNFPWNRCGISDLTSILIAFSAIVTVILLIGKSFGLSRRRYYYGFLGIFLVAPIPSLLTCNFSTEQVSSVAVTLILLATVFSVFKTSYFQHICFVLVEQLRRHYMAGYRRKRYQVIANKLAQAINPGSYDAIHCHDIIALIAGTHLKKNHPHLRLIWDAHELYEELASGTQAEKELVTNIIRHAEGHIDVFITISESFREIYARNHPKLPPALVVMNATRNIGEIFYDGRLHRAAGLSRDRKILLFQGGFSRHRGINQLLEATTTLPQPWSVVLMGSGKLEPEISAAISRLCDPNQPKNAPLVMLPSAPQEELPFWTAGATLGIIPYENTGLNHLYCTPNKLWEYPNAGVPILATSLIEMEKIIQIWQTGFLLPRNFNSQDILHALHRLTQTDLETAKEKCRVFVASMSWDKFEDVLLSAYSS